jgi:Spy/CpxP family protein refolding chaperone
VRYRAVLAALLVSASAVAGPDHRSKYAGQEDREIKTLSADDIEELRRAGGWGLAKAAELNGVPGPVHVLEMKDEIDLTERQEARIRALYEGMRAEALPLGERLIELEARLNTSFAERTVDRESLQEQLRAIERVRADLRMVHLSRHLATADVLTAQQIDAYNRLRGYGSNPCRNVPEGHDPEMWKRHNDCP